MDMGHFLGMMQISNAMAHATAFDIHMDGTTKIGKMLEGQKLTIDDGSTLAFGYKIVASENADTLASVIADLLEEASTIFSDNINEQHKQFLQFTEKTSPLMSDRAAVMKAFDDKFNDMRHDLLLAEEDIQFLFCNAHFFLGLSSAVNKILVDKG